MNPVRSLSIKMGFKPLALSLAIALISSCGGVGQDVGESNSGAQQQSVSGRVIDGHIARSVVFFDSNNNGTRDAWEAFAFTDNEGYYSYNPNSDIDYCAATATVQQQQYCLVSSVGYSDVVIRAEGGYDVLTVEPFLGQMSRRINNSDQTHKANLIISPITSLLTNITETQEIDTVLNSLNLSSTDIDIDYLNVGGTGAANMNLFNAAVKVHKVVTVLSDRLTDNYTEIGANFGTPNDASSTVYRNLARQLISSATSFDEAVANPSDINSVLTASETALRNIYSSRELELPAVIDSSRFSRASELANNVVQVTNRVIDRNESIGTNMDSIRGAARAIETLIIKANEEHTVDPSIQNMVNFITNQSNGALVTHFIQSLAGENADVSTLTRNNFTAEDFESEDTVTIATQLPDLAQRFNDISGKRIRVSDLDLGFAPNRLRDMELELYFQGAPSDTEGRFTACAKFIEDAHSDGTLGEGNTRGELIAGFWSLLGAAEGSSYNLLLTIEFLGSTYSAIVKAVGPTTINDVSYQQFRVDNDGEYRIWHSTEGITVNDSVPTSSSECRTRLPSRINL